MAVIGIKDLRIGDVIKVLDKGWPYSTVTRYSEVEESLAIQRNCTWVVLRKEGPSFSVGHDPACKNSEHPMDDPRPLYGLFLHSKFSRGHFSEVLEQRLESE